MKWLSLTAFSRVYDRLAAIYNTGFRMPDVLGIKVLFSARQYFCHDTLSNRQLVSSKINYSDDAEKRKLSQYIRWCSMSVLIDIL